ncbi:hypothetical protein I3843_14G130600 [Carya illinoinensis]|nr:hypothetical protein I3843_14G130600 [Carya illinoinensis]
MMMTKIDFHFRGDNITLPFCGGYLPFFPEFFDSFSFFPKQQACCFTAVFLYQSRALTRSLHPFDARASNLPHFLLVRTTLLLVAKGFWYRLFPVLSSTRLPIESVV